jgi:ribosomal protein S18 acetylase RimI-like enzyme
MNSEMTMATTTPLDIHRASLGEVPRIAATLARAFFDDPVFRWAAPDDDRRRELLPAFFALVAETLARYDEIHVAGPGAALWVPPGGAPVPDDLAPEFGRRMLAIAGADAERLFEVSELIDSRHPSGSFYFLQFIGVEPAAQGRGLGSRLLVHMLERCDREGTRAYLDATSEANKRLYERHGFRASGEYAPVGGPPLWPMWREPIDFAVSARRTGP